MGDSRRITKIRDNAEKLKPTTSYQEGQSLRFYSNDQDSINEVAVDDYSSDEDDLSLLDRNSPQREIKLKSSEGKVLIVQEAALRKSAKLATLLDELDAKDDGIIEPKPGLSISIDRPIPLGKVNSFNLELCILWCNNHMFDRKLSKFNRMVYLTKPWESSHFLLESDTRFLGKLTKDQLFDLNEVAAYLEIEGLVDATCKLLANLTEGKTIDEIRNVFDIENDFTEQELNEQD